MPEPTDLPLRLHHALLSRGETVAAAESLTAGLFCAGLAAVPGRQRDPARGCGRLRDGPEDGAGRRARRTCWPRTARSARETAAALADGVRDRCGATWGIGLTGVAGPDPVDGHGPGRVYLGISDGRRTDVAELDLPGDRAAVRAGAVTAAMDGAARRGWADRERTARAQVLRHQRTRAGRSDLRTGRRVP